MALTYTAQGTTVTFAGLTVYPVTITLPGWEKSDIDMSTLSNAAWCTTLLSTLKKMTGPIVLKCPYDAAVRDAVPETNQECTITLPSAAGAYTFWADVRKVGDVELTKDDDQTEQLTYDIELTVTNLNGALTETGPAFA
jgi:hypothetical protein